MLISLYLVQYKLMLKYTLNISPVGLEKIVRSCIQNTCSIHAIFYMKYVYIYVKDITFFIINVI